MSQEDSGQKPPEDKFFQVLAISGGGYRGLHAAKALAELEEKLHTSVAAHFELISGTSIGGVIALGLAAGLPASKMVELIQENGCRVFDGPWWHTGKLFHARHSGKGLKAVLEEIFEDRTLGDLKSFVLIPAVDASTGKARVFKTPHHHSLLTDHALRLVDVAMATTAAPTFFPIFKHESTKRLFVDGGLIANAPGELGLHEALYFFDQNSSRIRILSVGTAATGRNVRVNALNKGAFSWGSQLFQLTISAQESLSDYKLKHALGPDRYYRLDSTSIDMERAKDIAELDKCNNSATETLLAHASDAAQGAVANALVQSMLNHEKLSLPWYQGPNATPMV